MTTSICLTRTKRPTIRMPTPPAAPTGTRIFATVSAARFSGTRGHCRTPAYDPIGGETVQDAPARATLYSYLTRWMRDFRVDGIRMDSVENVANWDFIQGYKDRARTLFQERWQAAGLGAGADEHFLVVGEELTLPFALLTQQRLDGLWNEEFLRRLRPRFKARARTERALSRPSAGSSIAATWVFRTVHRQSFM